MVQLAHKAGSGAGGKPTRGAGAPTSAEEHFGQPNVLVAHLKEGIEAIHLYTGEPGPPCCLAEAAAGVSADAHVLTTRPTCAASSRVKPSPAMSCWKKS